MAQSAQGSEGFRKLAGACRWLRFLLPVTLLSGYCLWSNIQDSQILRQKAPLLRPGADTTTKMERLFDAVRNELPRSGIIGYIDERADLPHGCGGPLYFLSQYTLAPLVLDPMKHLEITVVVGTDPSRPTDPWSGRVRVERAQRGAPGM